MISKNKFLKAAIVLVLVQQILLAISTYLVALAGKSLGNGKAADTLLYIMWFFIIALLAYISSSFNNFLVLKLKNSLWKDYIQLFFKKHCLTQDFNTIENKNQTTAWLSGEANLTIEEISYFIIDTVSMYLNVVFTFAIFLFTLGRIYSAIIAISLVSSLILVSLLNNKIEQLASKSQTERLSINTYLPTHWEYLLNSSTKFLNNSQKELNSRLQSLFVTLEKYTLWEQLLATIPIIISVPLLVFYIFSSQSTQNLAKLGVLLAVLPRTLQLLGNVHELSISNSRLIFIRSKYKRLLSFSLIENKPESNITAEKIQIFDGITRRYISTHELQEIVKHKRFYGRVLITGDNGSGKSSLIKTLKSLEKNSVIISPESEFNFQQIKASTGQRQLEKINFFLQEDFNVIFLDEWTANLDTANINMINNLLNEAATRMLIIEVVHKNQ